MGSSLALVAACESIHRANAGQSTHTMDEPELKITGPVQFPEVGDIRVFRQQGARRMR